MDRRGFLQGLLAAIGLGSVVTVVEAGDVSIPPRLDVISKVLANAAEAQDAGTVVEVTVSQAEEILAPVVSVVGDKLPLPGARIAGIDIEACQKRIVELESRATRNAFRNAFQISNIRGEVTKALERNANAKQCGHAGHVSGFRMVSGKGHFICQACFHERIYSPEALALASRRLDWPEGYGDRFDEAVCFSICTGKVGGSCVA